MSDKRTPAIGSIGWLDLTVQDAGLIRDFYRAIVGWEAEGCDMGGFEDFVMTPPGGEAVAGICHARGEHADLPTSWLVYIVVADLGASLAKVSTKGGKIIARPRVTDGGRFAVIRDPAGAVCALYQSTP